MPEIPDPRRTAAATPPPAPSGPPPPITVVICTHDRAELLRLAARSVIEQMTADVELLVVDNAGSDATQAVVASLAPAAGVITFLREREVGLSVARNTALREAQGRWVLFLDDDAEALPGWLDAYRGFVVAPPDPRIAVVGGPVAPVLEATPPRWMAAGAFALDRGERTREISARGGPWGCNIAYDRAAALAAGGFSSHFGHRGLRFGAHEETELNARLERAGRTIWWLPGAAVRHRVAASRLTLSAQSREQIEAGRAAAQMRLGAVSGHWRRLGVILVRLLEAPPHALVLALVALATCPFPPRRQSALSVVFAARQLGITMHMLQALPRSFSRHPLRGRGNAR